MKPRLTQNLPFASKFLFLSSVLVRMYVLANFLFFKLRELQPALQVVLMRSFCFALLRRRGCSSHPNENKNFFAKAVLCKPWKQPKKQKRSGFTIVELSIVIIIIGIVLAGITSATRMVYQFKLTTARSITTGAGVNSIYGLLLWFDSTAEKAISDSESMDGNTVTKWYDTNPQQVFKYTLSQNISANRPTYVAKGQNGLPVLRFASTSATVQTMSTNSIINDLANNPSFTAFIVASSSHNSSSVARMIQLGNQSYACTGVNVSYWSSNQMAIVFNGGEKAFTVPASSNAGILEVVRDSVVGASSVNDGTTVYFNGKNSPLSARNNGDCTPSLVFSSMLLSPDTPISPTTWSMDFAEILIFNRVLKNDERKDIRDYLAKKWSIKVS